MNAALMHDLISYLASARDGAGNPIFHTENECGNETALDIAFNTPQEMRDGIIQGAALLAAFIFKFESDDFVGGWVTDMFPREQIHEAIRIAASVNSKSVHALIEQGGAQ